MKELLADWRIRRMLLANIMGSIGSGITIIAIPWLLVQRPGGEKIFGYITVAATVLLFGFAPYYGAWLDRHSRKAALLAGEVFGATATLTMATWILLTGETATWQLVTLYFCGMLYYTLHFPARFAFVQQIFARKHYQQLVGLMEIQGQTASFLAGGLASVLLVYVPFYGILLFDAGTYLFSLTLQSTLPYKADHVSVDQPRINAWRSLGEGLGWLRARPQFTLFVLCALAPFVAVMTGQYLFPIYVQKILEAPASVYGRGEMAFAFGAILAGVFAPKLITRHAAANVAFAMMLIFIIGLVLLGGLHTIPTFYCALIFLGLGNAGTRVARGSLMLHEVPNAIIGRVQVVIAAGDRLLRTIMQFGAIAIVIYADSAWAFIGLVLFVGLALALAWSARKGVLRPDPYLPEAPTHA
ncbi:MAG: MFS transporter [Cephaloticoccus sp.]|nr:MFS transporter [Cephaloticoccus sp.]MCF7760896.1 MFS transporter [Cephaloticoccus sp.]